MPGVALATIYHDPHGLLGGRIRELYGPIARAFSGVAVHVTQAAPRDVVEFLSAQGALLEHEDHPPAGLAGIGRGRREAVALALRLGTPHILYADLDHALRWVRSDEADLARLLARGPDHDFTVVGRTGDAIAELPSTLRDTESIVNRVFASVTGRAWDVMSAVRLMSAGVARTIAESCTENSIANDVAWPLFCMTRGMRVGYHEAPGLRYEDDAQFARPDEVSSWHARLESDPNAWAVRLRIALADLEALANYAAPE